MKVFVTGATGLIGAHTALYLHQRGHSLRLLVRDEKRARQWFAQHGVELDDYVQADMSNQQVIEQAMQGCDAVLHAASVINLDAKDKAQTIQTNLQGLHHVVGTACQLGIKKILYVSSVSVFFDPKAKQLDESLPLVHSSDPYTHSKVLCEQQVRQWQELGYPIICSYPSGVFGPDDPKLSQSNEGLLLLSRDLMPMTSSGMQFVDVRDLAKAQVLLLEKPLLEDKTQERYVIGGHFLSWPQFADALDQLGRRKVRRIPLPGALFRLLGCVYDGLRRWFTIHYPISRESAAIVTQMSPSNSNKLLATVDVHFTPYQTTLADTVQWLEDAGFYDK